MRRKRSSGRSGPFDAAQPHFGTSATAIKYQITRQALDTGGEGDVKMESVKSLERFPAQSEWEIPVRR